MNTSRKSAISQTDWIESQEYIPISIYIQTKGRTSTCGTHWSLLKKKKNSIEIIVGIRYLGSSKTVSNGRKATAWWTYDHFLLPTTSLRPNLAQAGFWTCSKPSFELTFTRTNVRLPYSWSHKCRTFDDCVHLRLLAFTCDNLSQPSVTYRNS